MEPTLGIALGDVTGIGPEVTLKALAAEAAVGDARFLILGDPERVGRLNDHLGLPLRFQPPGPVARRGVILVDNPLTEPLPPRLSPGAPEAARAAVAWLREGAKRCLRHDLAALITAPVNKHAIVQAGVPFVGQTELLSQLAATPRTAMMLLGHDDRDRWLRVALVTTHLPLRRVADSLDRARIEQTIELAVLACRDLGLPRARIAVCGLNPHAGEGGEFGSEDEAIISPAVQAARSRGLEVSGPLPADTLFHHALRGDFEAVVAMYHDQGLGPLKMIAFETGVNWTLGLPFIRTSPDHGTAYDIAGQGKADPSSMIAAIRLARQLARRG